MKIWDLFFLGHKNRQPFYEYNMDGQCTCDYTIENSAKKNHDLYTNRQKKSVFESGQKNIIFLLTFLVY